MSSKRNLAFITSGLAIFLFTGAAVATTSRAGLSLTVFAAFLVFMLHVWQGLGVKKLTILTILGAVGFFVVFQTIGSVFENVVDRYSVVDDDLRWQFWEQSGVIISNYFPTTARPVKLSR